MQLEEDTSLSQPIVKFWAIEDFMASRHLTGDEKFCEEHYVRTTVCGASGRYIVNLSFVRDPKTVGETDYSVLSQFTAMQLEQQRDPEFLAANNIPRLHPDPNHP